MFYFLYKSYLNIGTKNVSYKNISSFKPFTSCQKDVINFFFKEDVINFLKCIG